MRRRGHAPAAQSDLGAKTRPKSPRGHPITTTLQDKKAARGTKRVCQACDVRFYDLSRDPIVCPSCGARCVPAVPQASEAQPGMFTDKTGWRRKAFRRSDPEPDAADTAANDNVTEGANEETSGPVSDQDVVLDEQEQDEADVTAFVDHRDAEPNER
jgi:uncharacterized protein (TIGR02300 family)